MHSPGQGAGATRLLVTGAGTAGGNNLLASLRSVDPSLGVVGCHHDRFVLKRSTADRNYLVPPPGRRGFARALRGIVDREKIALVIPTSDAAVGVLARLRGSLPCRLFLPRRAAIDLCQDKYRLARVLGARGVPVPRTCAVRSLGRIDELFRRLAGAPLLWCRARRGSGAVAALPVKRPEQARSWIAYWHEMRGIPITEFTLSEYLPGRDFACQALWKDGTLVLVKTCERISYFVGGGQPSGVSSVSALAKTVCDPRVVEVCAAAVRAVDRRASGAFNIDLKENARGEPCVTEINAGRFASGTAIFDLPGKHNMTLTYVRLALGEPVGLRNEYDVDEGYYSLRGLDSLPRVFDVEALFEDIEDART